MSDGETPQEAITSALSAFDEWMDAAKTRGIEAPTPFSAARSAQAEREELFAAIRSMRAHHDEIDDRLIELERRVVEIEEQVEQREAWGRFTAITGPQVASITVRRSLLIAE